MQPEFLAAQTATIRGQCKQNGPILAIGILAWNEEKAIARTLDSLFRQSLFGHLNQRRTWCEIFCVVNGSTDRTGPVAKERFGFQQQRHSHRHAFLARVVELAQQGKSNAWNQFVHSLSAREARFLVLMDADILLHRPNTMWDLLMALEGNAQAVVAVDRPCKDLEFKRHPTPWERLSLAAARLTGSAEAQLCGQLYAIRSTCARNIYLPRDLTCEDGFIKTVVCTDFLTSPQRPERIVRAAKAAHTFAAYTSPIAILRHQKRQILGQTLVHVLVDRYLKQRPLAEREHLAETLRQNELRDPAWLKRLIEEHLHQARFWWRLYPGLLGHRFRMIRRLPPVRRGACLLAALAEAGVALIASFLAFRALRNGCPDYWPASDRGDGAAARPSATFEGWAPVLEQWEPPARSTQE